MFIQGRVQWFFRCVLPSFFSFDRELLTTVATRPCRLYIDKSQGHKIQSRGPSVKTHLPAAEVYFHPSFPSHWPAASGILNKPSPLQMRCHWFCVNPPGRSNLIWYQWWLNETPPGRSGKKGRRGEGLAGFFSPKLQKSTSACFLSS